MESSLDLPLVVAVPQPSRGGSVRLQPGSCELVLESVRGGHSLLWSDGRTSRRFALGLIDEGRLTLELRAPRLPVRVITRDVISLVPGGRLRGYLQVPLVPSLVWHREGAQPAVLIELLPRELAAEWDDREGHSFRSPSSLHARFPMRTGEPRVVVPVVLTNPSANVASPPHVPLQLMDSELVELRRTVVVKPRRLRWMGEQFAIDAKHTGVQVQP
ncbi:MAG TPA: hypothetical protein VF384_08470 [Planctomycetota bacterium]